MPLVGYVEEVTHGIGNTSDSALTSESDTSRVLPTTSRRLEMVARRAQSEGRVPGLVAAVGRGGGVAWSAGVGKAEVSDPEVPLDTDTPFVIASNTKTFIAVVVMALRDEGRLKLDDPVETYLPGVAHGDMTVRSMLTHLSGMQREDASGVWDDMRFPTAEQLIAGLGEAARISTPNTHWHYSNLCYAVLGELIALIDGGDWFASVRRRILEPLEMRSTYLGQPAGDAPRRLAGTYFVPPWSDVPLPEPVIGPGAYDAVGGMVSTARDMVRWGGFVADPLEEVLAPSTMEEMCTPTAFADPREFRIAHGLGFMVLRDEQRLWVGHTGGMPGAVSGLFTHRSSATTGLVLMNASNAPPPGEIAVDLGGTLLECEPQMPPVWEPGQHVPEEFATVIGRWFSEGQEHIFSVRRGSLQARVEGAPAEAPPSTFEKVEDDVYRAVGGTYRGELLRLHRDSTGVVRRMHWATYPFTREPLPFTQG